MASPSFVHHHFARQLSANLAGDGARSTPGGPEVARFEPEQTALARPSSASKLAPTDVIALHRTVGHQLCTGKGNIRRAERYLARAPG